LVLVAAIYGLNYVFIKALLEEVPTTRAWVFIRIASATLLILPIVWMARRPLPPRDTWWWLLLAAILGVVFNQVLFAEGLARTTPGHSAVINTAIPILTLCFAVLAHQERFTIRKVTAIGVALSGVLILLEADRLILEGPSLQQSLVGDLLTLGNAASFSIFLVLMRNLGRRVDPLMTTAVCFAIGTVIIGAYGGSAVDSENVRALLSPTVLPLALFGIVACTVLVYFLNNWALHHTHSSQVALYIYLQPVVATGLSMHLGWDDPGPRFYLATALVFCGLLLQSSWGRQPRARNS
jgi:drug/metabolite transporter (DMT)-like permease